MNIWKHLETRGINHLGKVTKLGKVSIEFTDGEMGSHHEDSGSIYPTRVIKVKAGPITLGKKIYMLLGSLRNHREKIKTLE